MTIPLYSPLFESRATHRGMTTISPSTASTPLESLLLCQYVATHGIANTQFERLSDELRKSSIVKDSSNYDDSRLGADALQTLFLQLLKAEAEAQLQHALDSDKSANGLDGGNTKQQAKSPQLAKIEDAHQHAQLIPQLVDKLFVSYKDHALQEIRDEELRYRELVASSRRDDQQAQTVLQKEVNAQENLDVQAMNRPAEQSKIAAPVQRPTSVATRDDTNRPTARSSIGDLKIESILNPDTGDARPTNAPRSPIRPMPLAVAPTPPNARSQPVLAPATTPRAVSQSGPHHPPYDPVRPNLGGSPTFFNGQSGFNPPILPQVPGMAAPQTHWSPAGSPVIGRPSPLSGPPRQLPSPVDLRRTSLPPSAQSPQHTGPPHMHAIQPYSPRQQQLPSTPVYQPPPPQRGGVMLPPFQVQPQVPNPAVQQQMQRPVSSATNVRAPLPAHQYAMSEPRVRQNRTVEDLKASSSGVAKTPPARSVYTQHKPQFFFSPGSNTGYKPSAALRPLQHPIRRPSNSPERDDPPMTNKAAALSTNKGTMSKKETSLKKADHITTKAASTTKKGKATARAISKTPSVPATSTAGARTRSQSVTSQQHDELSFTSVTSNKNIKNEPATPAVDIDENSEISETPTRPKGGRGRGRGSISAASVAAAASKKRKRGQESVADGAATPSARTESPAIEMPQAYGPDTIIAYRNFHKMTAPIMNNITSHKHASLFANPVKERDAEGYTDIIRRPQDLKSIRAAIMAGSRAVAAATAGIAESPAGTPGAGTPNAGASTPGAGNASGTGMVPLPWSTDLVPPKGIVNGAQLEQELCRMFANAVMFNPGNEGVVRDTREMFESVEVAVAAWRATEKERVVGISGGGTDKGRRRDEDEGSVDELGDVSAVETGGGASANKRRRTLGS